MPPVAGTGTLSGASPELGRYVLERLRFRKGAELLQALVLDLPDPLASDVERPPDLVQRPRMLAVESVPKLEHPPLARRQRGEHAPKRGFAQLFLGDLVRQRFVLVGQKVSELRLLVVADRLLQRDRRLRAATGGLDLLRVEPQPPSPLPRVWLPARLRPP